MNALCLDCGVEMDDLGRCECAPPEPEPVRRPPVVGGAPLTLAVVEPRQLADAAARSARGPVFVGAAGRLSAPYAPNPNPEPVVEPAQSVEPSPGARWGKRPRWLGGDFTLRLDYTDRKYPWAEGGSKTTGVGSGPHAERAAAETGSRVTAHARLKSTLTFAVPRQPDRMLREELAAGTVVEVVAPSEAEQKALDAYLREHGKQYATIRWKGIVRRVLADDLERVYEHEMRSIVEEGSF